MDNEYKNSEFETSGAGTDYAPDDSVSEENDAHELAETNQEEEYEVLHRITTRVDELWSWWERNIEESEIDRDMHAGIQWSEQSLQDRQGEITLTVNKLPQFVERVMGDILQNEVCIKYRATTYDAGAGTLMGKIAKQEYTRAEVRSSIAKTIELKSNAKSWYDRASNQMAVGGFGWLRVDAIADDYGRPIMEISGVINPSDAMIDYSGIQDDWSDARDAVVFTKMPKKKFKEMFPDASTTDFNTNQMSPRFTWATEEFVIVAEYMERVRRPQAEIMAEVNQGIYRPVYQVVWRRLSGNKILEGGARGVVTPFSTINLVPMIGSEVVTSDGMRLFQSVHRQARDAQKDANFWRSSMTQMVDNQPNQPWVATAAMVEGQQAAWESANTAKPSLLLRKPDPLEPGAKPEKAPPPDIPAAAMQLYLTATNDLNQAIGMRSDFSGEVRNDESGRAILAKERQDSTGKYGFTNGRNNAIKRVGNLLKEGMAVLYQNEQEVRIYNEDQTNDFVQMPEGLMRDDGDECYVEAGADYATQRIETVNVMMDLAKAMPEQMAVGLDIITENLDFPAAQRLADRIKRSMNPAVLSKNEREELQKEQAQEQQQPAQPDPNAMIALEIEKAKQAQSEARVMAEKLKAQQEQLQAEQEKLRLMAEQSKAANENQVKDLVAQALAEFIKESKGGIP
jgi:hypothetical protein